jgi:hypothetical protein
MRLRFIHAGLQMYGYLYRSSRTHGVGFHDRAPGSDTETLDDRGYGFPFGV